MDMGTATLKYDFASSGWWAIADWNDDLKGVGETPEQAVDSLKWQCDKHNLWPERKI
jgi:hypothetical protein